MSTQTCDHEGCTEEGIACFLLGSHEPDEFLCFDHAREEGYCPGCGQFWAGVESFDFRLNGTSFCENCFAEVDDSWEDDDLDFGWDEYVEYEDIIEEETGGRYIGPGSESLNECPPTAPLRLN